MLGLQEDGLPIARVLAPLVMLWGGYFITNPERATAGHALSREMSGSDPTGKSLAVIAFLAGLVLVEGVRSWPGFTELSRPVMTTLVTAGCCAIVWGGFGILWRQPPAYRQLNGFDQIIIQAGRWVVGPALLVFGLWFFRQAYFHI